MTDTAEAREYRDLLFNVRRSARYHSHRQRHYDGLNQFVLFLALILSSASIAAFATEVGQMWGTWVQLLPSALVTVSAGLNLVVGAARKARLHADFVREYTNLERRLVAPDGKTPEAVAGVTDSMLEIESSEPPILRVLDTICYNELQRAMGYDWKDQIPVGPFQRLCSRFFDVRAHTLHRVEAS